MLLAPPRISLFAAEFVAVALMGAAGGDFGGGFGGVGVGRVGALGA